MNWSIYSNLFHGILRFKCTRGWWWGWGVTGIRNLWNLWLFLFPPGIFSMNIRGVFFQVPCGKKNISSLTMPCRHEDGRLSVLKLFHALRWSTPRCREKIDRNETDTSVNSGLATRWSCGRFQFVDFFWLEKPFGCNLFFLKNNSEAVSFGTSFSYKLWWSFVRFEVKVMWEAWGDSRLSTLADRWWKRWIASGWLGVLPYVRTRVWWKRWESRNWLFQAWSWWHLVM